MLFWPFLNVITKKIDSELLDKSHKELFGYETYSYNLYDLPMIPTVNRTLLGFEQMNYEFIKTSNRNMKEHPYITNWPSDKSNAISVQLLTI